MQRTAHAMASTGQLQSKNETKRRGGQGRGGGKGEPTREILTYAYLEGLDGNSNDICQHTFSMSSAIFRSPLALIRLIWRAATNTNSARLPASGPDNDDALRPSYGGTLPTSWTRTAVFASYQRRALRDSNRWNQRWRAGYNCCHRHFALHSLNRKIQNRRLLRTKRDRKLQHDDN